MTAYTKPPEGQPFILVTGDREWTDSGAIDLALSKYPVEWDVMHGDARGADKLAGQVAARQGRTVHRWPAEWELYGRSAGPKRNIDMLDTKPTVVLAFHDDIDNSHGTKHCTSVAAFRGIPVRFHKSLPALVLE